MYGVGFGNPGREWGQTFGSTQNNILLIAVMNYLSVPATVLGTGTRPFDDFSDVLPVDDHIGVII